SHFLTSLRTARSRRPCNASAPCLPSSRSFHVETYVSRFRVEPAPTRPPSARSRARYVIDIYKVHRKGPAKGSGSNASSWVAHITSRYAADGCVVDAGSLATRVFSDEK